MLIFIAVLLSFTGCGSHTDYRDGDLIFHSSKTDQAAAIEAATGSPYSHMGIIFLQDGETKLRDRYRDDIPRDEDVISPAAMPDSDLRVEIDRK